MVSGQNDATQANLPIPEPVALQAASQGPKLPVGGVSCTICGAETEGGNALCAHCEKLIPNQARKHD
jgi:hypothetical protein